MFRTPGMGNKNYCCYDPSPSVYHWCCLQDKLYQLGLPVMQVLYVASNQNTGWWEGSGSLGKVHASLHMKQSSYDYSECYMSSVANMEWVPRMWNQQGSRSTLHIREFNSANVFWKYSLNDCSYRNAWWYGLDWLSDSERKWQSDVVKKQMEDVLLSTNQNPRTTHLQQV